jgi:zinc transport system ATP-binding protein
MEKVIEVKNLSVELDGYSILEDISFSVKKCETLALVGPNGSGKTTLIKAMLGLIPYSGEVKILGFEPYQRFALKGKIGYVPQKLEFDRRIPLTVNELYRLFQNRHHHQKHYLEILDLVGGSYLIDKRLEVLSGGEFQRILIGLSILNNPEILFLDEPAAGVDVEGENVIFEFLANLGKKREMTLIIVSHDVHFVSRFASRVLCINRRLICDGPPEIALTPAKLKELYEHKYVKKK